MLIYKALIILSFFSVFSLFYFKGSSDFSSVGQLVRRGSCVIFSVARILLGVFLRLFPGATRFILAPLVPIWYYCLGLVCLFYGRGLLSLVFGGGFIVRSWSSKEDPLGFLKFLEDAARGCKKVRHHQKYNTPIDTTKLGDLEFIKGLDPKVVEARMYLSSGVEFDFCVWYISRVGMGGRIFEWDEKVGDRISLLSLRSVVRSVGGVSFKDADRKRLERKIISKSKVKDSVESSSINMARVNEGDYVRGLDPKFVERRLSNSLGGEFSFCVWYLKKVGLNGDILDADMRGVKRRISELCVEGLKRSWFMPESKGSRVRMSLYNKFYYSRRKSLASLGEGSKKKD